MHEEEEVDFFPVTLSPTLSPTLAGFLFGDIPNVDFLEDMPPFSAEDPFEPSVQLPEDFQFEMEDLDAEIVKSQQEQEQEPTEAIPELPNLADLLGPHAALLDPLTSDSFPLLYQGLKALATEARMFYFWIVRLSIGSIILREFAAYSIAKYAFEQSAADFQEFVSSMMSEQRVDQEFIFTIIDVTHPAIKEKKFYAGLHLLALPTSNIEHWPWTTAAGLVPFAVPIVVFVDGEESGRIRRGDFIVGAWQISGKPRTLDPSLLNPVNSKNFSDPTGKKIVHFQVDRLVQETLEEGEVKKNFVFPFESLVEKRKRRRGRKATVSFSLTDDGIYHVRAGRRTHDVTFSRFVGFSPFSVPLLGEDESLISVDATARLALIPEGPTKAQEEKFQHLMAFFELPIAVGL